MEFFLVFATVLALWFIYKLFNLSDLWSRSKVAVKEHEQQRDSLLYYQWTQAFLSVCANVYAVYPIKTSAFELTRLEFYITRLGLHNERLGRKYTAAELKGFFLLLSAIGVFFVVIGVVVGAFFIVVGVALLVLCNIPDVFFDYVVGAQDQEIESCMPDLYLMLFSKLYSTSSAAILPTVRAFSDVLKVSKETHPHMEKFIGDFMGLLSNNDDAIAVQKLGLLYRSGLVVNFVNIVNQRLNGAMNLDKLVTFKQELSQLKMDAMRKKVEVMRRKGMRAINVVYVILAEIIILSIVSRLPAVGTFTF